MQESNLVEQDEQEEDADKDSWKDDYRSVEWFFYLGARSHSIQFIFRRIKVRTLIFIHFRGK